MGSVGVGWRAGFAYRLSDFSTGFVDQRVMNRAMRRMDDAMAIRLKEADLGVSRVAADGQPRAMAMATTGHSMHARVRKAGGRRDFEESRPRLFGEVGGTEAWAAGTRRAMGAFVSVGHAESLARPDARSRGPANLP